MTKIIAHDLVFPESVHFFGPKSHHSKHKTHPSRQKVRGKLRLVTSQPTKLDEVEIMFHGQTHLSWKDPRKSQGSLLIGKLSAFKILRKSRQVLLKQGTLPAGVTDLGFEVSIPGYLYPSFRSEYVDTRYVLTARIAPKGKFAKDITVKREVALLKTLVPKDVACGQVNEYDVTRITMRGERPGSLHWSFKVPRYVCLEGCAGIEFEGKFRSLADDSAEIINMEVDVVQEELYTDGLAKKRHLIICSNTPSKYLYPPLNTPIALAFPLQPSKICRESRIRRVRSVPLRDLAHGQMKLSNSSSSNSIYANANCESSTIWSHGMLTYSQESSFLKIRHFVRIVIHLADAPPICIGLPFQITRRIDTACMPDSLPSYQSVAQDGARLPDYYADKLETDQAEDGEDDGEDDAVEEVAEQDSVNEASPARQRRRDETVVPERSQDDFSTRGRIMVSRSTDASYL